MKVQSINNYYGTKGLNISTNNNKRPSTMRTQAVDSVSFSGTLNYQKALKEATCITFLNDIDLERAVNKIFKSLNEDKTIIKQEKFDFISNLYEEYGLRGLLRELWTPNPQPKTKSFLNSVYKEIVPLVKQGDEAIVEIHNSGFQGFWNFSRKKGGSTRDVELIFTSANSDGNALTLTLTPNGRYAINQYHGNTTIYTEYHTSTGNRAREILQNKYSEPYTTYYNKDGTKAFFKNLFCGGIPPTDLKW